VIHSFDELARLARSGTKKRIALAMADEADALKAVLRAAAQGVAEPVLVGHQDRIRELASMERLELDELRIVHTDGEKECSLQAVALVRGGEAEVLMKGRTATSTLMKAVLDSQNGLKGAGLMSHLTLIESKSYPKLLLMSDPGLNIAPDLAAKVSIVENAVRAARRLGVTRPKVAIIAAVEKVNPGSMPSTADAAILSKMAERGQLQDCIVDGPLSLDNALSAHSCEIKGISSPVGGEADILIMPGIEAANVFYKTLAFFTDVRLAGVVLGARVPIVLPSRADSDSVKLDSILAAVALA
jgi:phosphate butyryltransferase